MMIPQINLHGVTKIEAAYHDVGDVRSPCRWLRLRITDKAGDEVEVDCFVDGPIAIEGADRLALMVAPEEA